MEEKHTIGIDFGTTYSCVGAWSNGGVIIIPNEIGDRTTPSVVIFEDKNKIYIGEETLNHLPKKNTVKIYEIKRLIGKKYDEIKNIINYFSFKVEKKDEYPIIKITFDNGETEIYTPEFISSLIFQKLILNAEAFLNQKITDIVITVPADFNNNQRQAIKFAAESVKGINVLQIINEPSAAALVTYFLDFNKDKNNINIKNNSILDSAPNPFEQLINNNINLQNFNDENPINFSVLANNNFNETNIEEKIKHILIFDLGGGTYDVSLIEVIDTTFETVSSAGNQMLGGGDFDIKLMEYCLENFSRNINIDKNIIKNNYKSMERLKIACEQTKKILSVKEEDRIFIEDFYNEEALSLLITRAKFEDLCKECFKKLLNPLDIVLEDAKKDCIENIDEIILVGGSSRIPKIKAILSEKFPNVKINDSINPDEAVAYGATLFCEKLARSNNELLQNFNYFDSTQHSYGIEIENGEMEILLPKGSKYPTSCTRFFHNYFDNQTSFDIKVYEGENKLCKNNVFLAKFTLDKLPKKKKGELVCSVTFGIDLNQILKINAYVLDNDIKNGIIIKKENQLTKQKQIILENINNIEINLYEKEKELKNNIKDYIQNYNDLNNDNDRYKLIKNYNETINEYLIFLEEKYYDLESEKYLNLVTKLFQSYSNLFSPNFLVIMTEKEKDDIENNVKKYLKLISIKNPFRLRELIKHFESIKKSNSELFYSSSIYCMEILYEKGNFFYNLKKKNSDLVSKNIYEECLSIAKSNFNEESILNIIKKDLKTKYKEIKIECEKKIRLISAEFFKEIENTKKTGKLFSNNNLDYDNLSLLSFNFGQSLKKINSIENLSNNKEALETKSICLANIVKVEFLMKKRRLSINDLFNYADESIFIVDNKLGNNYTKKDWYKEIVQLKKDIEKEKKSKEIKLLIPPDEIEHIREEFEEKYNCGEEEFLKFLIEKYPYEGYNSCIDAINQYRKNNKKFLKILVTKYRKYNCPSKKEIILEYLNNLLNSKKK